MKINAICVVKNEADIIEETLLNAMKFCHRIYLFDNHSDDGTWEILQDMAGRFRQIVIAVRSDEVYRHQLRNRVYNMYHHLYDENDWWYIGDADELLDASVQQLLEDANLAEKNRVDVWLANFHFTDEDLQNYEAEESTQTFSERRRYYSIDWREARFFRNDPRQKWPEHHSERIPPWAGKRFTLAPVCRHYPERTPEQMDVRIAVRANNTHRFIKAERYNNQPSIRQAAKLRYYTKDGVFVLSAMDKLHFHLKAFRLGLKARIHGLLGKLAALGSADKVKSAVQFTKGY